MAKLTKLINVIGISNKDLFSLIDEFPTINITQRFKDRDFALEIPKEIFDQFTDRASQMPGVTVNEVTTHDSSD